jgi:hypothetical protein
MPAKLPPSLLKRSLPSYTIGTMPVGSEYDVERGVMLVDQDGSCYLDPDAKIKEVDFLHVRRDEAGYYVR